MTISGAISSALSALTLNANRISAVADNTANVLTTGFKGTEVRATTLVTDQASSQSSSGQFSSGGVNLVQRASVDVQGLLQVSSSATDLAISGAGFFVVDNGGGNLSFTRSGSFTPDNQGFLVNDAGARLLGFVTDSTGTPSGTLAAININQAGGTAEATTQIAIGANLPANAAIGDTSTVSVQVQDSLGNNLNLVLNFTKTGTNQATLTISNPVVNGTGVTSGTTLEGNGAGPAYSVGVQFNANGTIQGFDVNGDGAVDSLTLPSIFVRGSTTGADDLDIALDLGELGEPGGLTQFAGDFELGFVQADGASFGNVTGVSVSADGTVSARSSNGQSRPIYKIPIATFTNPNGLSLVSGNSYVSTNDSGPALFLEPGSGDVGTVQSNALEQSNIDLGTEFIRSIQAQIAYGAAVKVFNVADEMNDDLLDISS